MKVDYGVIKKIITEQDVYYIILEKCGLFLDKDNFTIGEKDEILNFLKGKAITGREEKMNYGEWHKVYWKENSESKRRIKWKWHWNTIKIFMIKVGAYYRDATMSELDLEYTKDLDNTVVSQKEYKYIQDKVDKIYNKYCKYFTKIYLSAS